MAGKITALFMAALIAVPFCCCLGEESPEVAAAEAHGCCHVVMPEAAPGTSETPEPCDCQEESPDQWVLAGETKPAPPHWTLLAEISGAKLSETAIVPGLDPRGAVHCPEAARPPGNVLWQVHCRYLL